MPSHSRAGESDLSSVTAASSVNPKSTSVQCSASPSSVSGPQQHTTPRDDHQDIAEDDPHPFNNNGDCPNNDDLLLSHMHRSDASTSISSSTSRAGSPTPTDATPTRSKSPRGSKRLRDELHDLLERHRNGHEDTPKRLRTMAMSKSYKTCSLRASRGETMALPAEDAKSPTALELGEGSAPVTPQNGDREKTPTPSSSQKIETHAMRDSAKTTDAVSGTGSPTSVQ